MPHYVKPTIDGDWTGMEFSCTEPETANCRLRCPGTDCEEFYVEVIDGKPWHVGYKYDDETDEETEGPLHEMSIGNPCGIIEWDALNEGYAGGPTTLREGEVKFDWNGDFYEWVYVREEHDAAYNERERIRAGVLDYYKVAPKAAESILRIIDGGVA